jgi:hypothetical protein
VSTRSTSIMRLISPPCMPTICQCFMKGAENSTACRINNAGTNAYKYRLLSDLGETDIVNIIETNVLGVMLCCREVRSRCLSCGLNMTAVGRFFEEYLEGFFETGYQGHARADQRHRAHLQHGWSWCRWECDPQVCCIWGIKTRSSSAGQVPAGQLTLTC